MESPSLRKYNEALVTARERFDANPGLNALRVNSNPQKLELFLLYFCSVGAQMTQPVEGWIRRAASRCAEIGFKDLAKTLNQHAQAESGHHLMMIADVHSLATHWNARHSSPVDADELLNLPPGKGARSYCKVHEQNIAGKTPYAQLAIEYEIEQLPLRYGSLFITRCLEVFGPEILPSLSFISAHIELDIGHTRFNERALVKLIDSKPDSVPALVAAGKAALHAYASFLNDCVELAERHYNAITRSSGQSTQFLSWRLEPPISSFDSEPSESVPGWLAEARALRGSVLFNNGRRPHFQDADGTYGDPDPIDPYAWHVLAYHRSSLVGCVRAYPLVEDGPACLTELLLGAKQFTTMLDGLRKQRGNVIEIGRWVVDPALRNKSSLAPGIGLELAAAAGALAFALARQTGVGKGVAIFSAGTRDKQYRTLSHLGLKAVPGFTPVHSIEYDDLIQVLYFDAQMPLQPKFGRIVEYLSVSMRIEETVQQLGNKTFAQSETANAMSDVKNSNPEYVEP